MTGVKMIGTAIESAKAVAKLAQEYGKMDLYQQAVELMAKVTEQQMQILELNESNQQMRSQIAELEEFAKIRDQLFLKGDIYYRKLPDGNKDGGFCTRCADVDRRLVRVSGYRSGLPYCPHCAVLKSGSKPV